MLEDIINIEFVFQDKSCPEERQQVCALIQQKIPKTLVKKVACTPFDELYLTMLCCLVLELTCIFC